MIGLSPTYLRSAGRLEDAEATELQIGADGRAEAQQRITDALKLMEDARRALEKAAGILGGLTNTDKVRVATAKLGDRVKAMWLRVSYSWRERERVQLDDVAALALLRKRRRLAAGAARIAGAIVDELGEAEAATAGARSVERSLAATVANATVLGYAFDDAPAPLVESIEAIARETLSVDTLKTQGSDRLDFHDVSAEGLRRALLYAVDLGARLERAKRGASA